MEVAIILKSIIIGIIEGLTEFLPISSTAHLVLASKALNFYKVKNGLFEVSIQLGSIVAVCLFYFQRLFRVSTTFFRNQNSRSFVYNLAIAFIPTALIGLFFYKHIKSMFFSIDNIAIALIVGGLAILLVEKLNIRPKIREIDRISKVRAFFIGIFQVIAMFPGVSRSGATIIGGMMLRLDRKTSVEFSFLLAIPTLFCACALDLYKNRHLLTPSNIEVIAIGSISAFVSAIIVINFFIKFISNNSLKIFGYYRILLGTLILALHHYFY